MTKPPAITPLVTPRVLKLVFGNSGWAVVVRNVLVVTDEPPMVMPAEPVTSPESVMVRPAATCQLWVAVRAMAASTVRLAVALSRSMPPEPSESVLPELIVTFPAGSITRIPCQSRSAPRATVLAEVTVLSHTATLPEPGTTPPTQPPASLRAVVLSALIIDWATAATGFVSRTEAASKAGSLHSERPHAASARGPKPHAAEAPVRPSPALAGSASRRAKLFMSWLECPPQNRYP